MQENNLESVSVTQEEEDGDMEYRVAVELVRTKKIQDKL